MRAAFDRGVSHYDSPPPEQLGEPGSTDSLLALCARDRFRFANRLSGWAEFDDDASVVDYGHDGDLLMGSSTVRVGPYSFTAAGVPMPTIRSAVTTVRGAVTLTQIAGGRTGLPLPRSSTSPPFIQVTPPLVWTTLSLTLRADGTSSFALIGASGFPRHWVYDQRDSLALKAGIASWKAWIRQPRGAKTPWGAEGSTVLVTAAETALERVLSAVIMGGGSPTIRSINAGEQLFRQGEPGISLALILDGVVGIDVDRTPLGELGPGTVLGERALISDGRRTATVTAVTDVRVAEVPVDAVDRDALERLALIHDAEG